MNLFPRRPFTVLTALGTAAHHGFEVRAGVGLGFEPFIGRRAAVAMWSGALPAWVLAGWICEGERIEKWIAINNGAGLAGGIVHFVAWPWERRHGIPYLTEAEGMTPEQLGPYTTSAGRASRPSATPSTGVRCCALKPDLRTVRRTTPPR